MSDIDLKALREAITEAEHKPGDWARAPDEMGGICSDYDMAALMVHHVAPPKSWGHFGFKRDGWLAIAAVNALPALLDRLESAERRAEEAEKERDEARGAAVKNGRDAERYRWIRSNGGCSGWRDDDHGVYGFGFPKPVGKAVYGLRGEAVDAILDAAMAQEGGK